MGSATPGTDGGAVGRRLADTGRTDVHRRDLDAPAWGPPAAGAAAGLAGLAVFLTLHAWWILPIWSVVPLGVAVATVGGVATGWAYDLLRGHAPAGPVGAWLAVTVAAVGILTPSLVLAYLGGPYVPVVDGVPASPSPDAVPAIAVRFVLEFVVVTTLAGAALGWWLERTRRAAVAVGAAALAFALGPGHNNPFLFTFGSTAAMGRGMTLVFAAVATASAVLVVVDRWCSRYRRRRSG